MLSDSEREAIADQMATTRSKMNFICDLLDVALMETSILSNPDLKHEQEQALVFKVRELNKVIEYYAINHKLLPIKPREK